MFNEIQIKSPADFHVHLRQGELCSVVTPHVRKGGFTLAYVMPNLQPPITTTEKALAYKAELERIDPNVEYLMTLYLTSDLTQEEIRKAQSAGIVGVKSYPRGVTTNSGTGIESYEAYYHIFETMQEVGMILNLHGEVPSNAESNICVLNAEAKFLPQLVALHKRFPQLKIVLEHATTRAAVETVKSLGPAVACTITAHHLQLTVDDWAGQNFHYCKPVAKFPDDREALREIVREGHPRFFLGSDSAPHPAASKFNKTPDHGCAAGVYTSPILLPLVATILENIGALDKLENFVSTYGRNFYGRQTSSIQRTITLKRILNGNNIPAGYSVNGEDVIVPYMASRSLGWSVADDKVRNHI